MYTDEKIIEHIDEALEMIGYGQTLSAIAAAHKLSIRQASVLDELIRSTLQTEDRALSFATVAKRLEIPEDAAGKLIAEMNAKIIIPLRDAVLKAEAFEDWLDTPEDVDLKDMRLAVDEPDEDALHPGDAAVLGAAGIEVAGMEQPKPMAAIEEKLSGTFGLPERAAAPEAAPKAPAPAFDPYRERL